MESHVYGVTPFVLLNAALPSIAVMIAGLKVWADDIVQAEARFERLVIQRPGVSRIVAGYRQQWVQERPFFRDIVLSIGIFVGLNYVLGGAGLVWGEGVWKTSAYQGLGLLALLGNAASTLFIPLYLRTRVLRDLVES